MKALQNVGCHMAHVALPQASHLGGFGIRENKGWPRVLSMKTPLLQKRSGSENQFSNVLQASYLRCSKEVPRMLVAWAVPSALPWHLYALADANYDQWRVPLANRMVWTAPACCTPDSSWKTLAGVRFCLWLVGGKVVET